MLLAEKKESRQPGPRPGAVEIICTCIHPQLCVPRYLKNVNIYNVFPLISGCCQNKHRRLDCVCEYL